MFSYATGRGIYTMISSMSLFNKDYFIASITRFLASTIRRFEYLDQPYGYDIA
jgi:hypothetical protein